jgi:hypothetical protein
MAMAERVPVRAGHIGGPKWRESKEGEHVTLGNQLAFRPDSPRALCLPVRAFGIRRAEFASARIPQAAPWRSAEARDR